LVSTLGPHVYAAEDQSQLGVKNHVNTNLLLCSLETAEQDQWDELKGEYRNPGRADMKR